MPNVNIGLYKRPGIYIMEYDESVITSPVATGINVLVIGFSKQGPINNPVLITNISDLTNIFGSIDRSLERNFSFFQRTIGMLIQSVPVYAMNLLATDPTLDLLPYQSLSAASSKSNAPLSTGPYSAFFNTTGFWKRDTQAVIEVTENLSDYANIVLTLTNYSASPVTVFIYKTQATGYDTSLLQWYGTPDQVPTYLNVNDYASDYMVDVIIVAGDWSNYASLSVDPIWKTYFATNGLITGQVNNFINNSNVNVLRYYTGQSLIPYFRDVNGNNIFVETTINADTNTTGIYCAYNVDLVETDYPTGMLDLIGNTLVGTQNTDIDFLSYSASLINNITYGDVPLDKPGNVWAIVGPSYSSVIRGATSNYVRTADYSYNYISGITATASSTPTSISFDVTYLYPYAVIGGVGVTVSTATSSFGAGTSSYPVGTAGTYSSALVLRSSGFVQEVDGITPNVNPVVNSNDLVLGYSTVYYDGYATFSNFNYINVYVNQTGYNELVLGTDYTVGVTAGTSSIVVTFLNTSSAPVITNYQQYRSISYFNNLISNLSSPAAFEMTMLTNMENQQKLSLAGLTVSNIQTSTSVNKSFMLAGVANYPDIVNGNLVFYTTDDEFVLGTNQLVTTNLIASTATGVVAQYSQFYLDYYNGNTFDGDYFYSNFITPGDVFNVSFIPYNGLFYVMFQTTTGEQSEGWPRYGIVSSDDTFMLPESALNTGQIEIINYQNLATYSIFGGNGNGTDGIYAFQVGQPIVAEYLSDVSMVYDINAQHFLQMYLGSTAGGGLTGATGITGGSIGNILNVTFVNSNNELYPLSLGPDFGGSGTINELANDQYGFVVWSDYLDYRTTVDVVYPVGYTASPNKILCDATRYANIAIGDFLQAYYNPASLNPGIPGVIAPEVPRQLTRILSKQIYPLDTSLIQLTCDSQIAVVNVGTSQSTYYQTTHYLEIDVVADTYQAIVLDGFTVRQASMPDGTEATQNNILNIVANGTPLFNALTNKDAIDFRYVVDSFGLGLIANSKQQLVDICGARLDCFGFINMPSMTYFASSQNPYFLSYVTASGNYQLDTALVAAGGNENLNPNFLYSFGSGIGVTTVGYFTPYLTISDMGRPLNLPPAMFVATTYLKKFSSNITSIVPWTIAAGVTNGKVTGFNDVEIDFTYNDLDNLNGAQMNPIVYKRNRGFVIDTENTALTLYKSSLSYIHCREVLIQLERALSNMLLDFQWQFNTPDIQASIKLKADTICENFVNLNGLYNYFNKCDSENNTPIIIDNQMGVLDTFVEVIKGMGIIVNNITILRTGSISSSGFITST